MPPFIKRICTLTLINKYTVLYSVQYYCTGTIGKDNKSDRFSNLLLKGTHKTWYIIYHSRVKEGKHFQYVYLNILYLKLICTSRKDIIMRREQISTLTTSWCWCFPRLPPQLPQLLQDHPALVALPAAPSYSAEHSAGRWQHWARLHAPPPPQWVGGPGQVHEPG